MNGKALHNHSHNQGQNSPLPRGTGSGPRDLTPQDEQKTQKNAAATTTRSGTKRPIANISQSNPSPIDPALLLPAPPQGFAESASATNPSAFSTVPSFSLDESSMTGASSSTPAVVSSWEDNTLAPMAWDDLN